MFIKLLLASLLVSPAAFAIPADGDYAAFTVTATDGRGGTRLGTYEIELSDHDDLDHTYLQTVTITWDDGVPQIQQQRFVETDFVSEAQIQATLTHCASYGGDLVTLATDAGTFNSCAVPTQNAEYTGISYTADVPFGYAKLTRVDGYGQSQVLVLKSFRVGANQ